MRSAGLYTLCLALCRATAALAQEGSVAGEVVAKGTLAPLPNAVVSVEGATLRAVTDAGGRFRIDGLTGSQAVLSVRRIGFHPVADTVRVGDTALRIVLAEKVVELDALVVTGTPAEVQRRALGNAVATIDAVAVTEVAQVNNLQELLNGRAAGVVIMPTSGTIGTGSRLRVRGTGSLSLSNQPLLYVDGVRVNNAGATGPVSPLTPDDGGPQGFGSPPVSRINDVNPEEIESVEIIKGPAAATLYGTEASNGVIQIITKRGTTGPARWTLMVKQGATFLANPQGRFWVNYQIDTVAGSPTQGQPIPLDLVEREDALGRPIFRTGHLQEYDLSVSGGDEQVRYFVGAGFEDSEGADKANKLRRYTPRASLTVTPSAKASVALNVGYATGRTNLPCEGGCGGRVWSTVLADPRKLAVPGRRGFHSGLPEEYDLLSQFSQDLDRFTASLQARHQPAPWFSHRLNLGTDRTREEDVNFTPRVDSLLNVGPWGSDPLGFKSVNDRSVSVTTVDYAATASVDIRPGLRSSTSAGGQFYRTETAYVYAEGSVFPSPGLTAVSATTTGRLNAEDLVEEKSIGFFVQEQVGWRDRLFITGGLRTDDHSAFGANFNRVSYPKVSASWVVSDERFWNVPAIDALRVRAAYGESGLQPATFAALPTYAPVTGPADSAAVTPQFIGNPDLGPERGKEIELGFDAELLNGRLGIDFTYYRKKTTDAILERQIAPSVGFSGFQPFNAGEVLNKGIEVEIRSRPYTGRVGAVDLSLMLATNSNKILDLDPRNPDPNEFVSAGTALRHQVGYPVGAWFEQRIVSADFDPVTDSATNVRCDNGQGGTVACSSAPNVFLGRTTPTLEGAFSAAVTLQRRIRLYALVDFKSGNRKIDGNTRVRCPLFVRCRENFFPEEFDPKRIAGIQSGTALIDYLIDDASFAKLREVSATYTLPEQWAAALGASRATVSVAGRNLHTWTKFGGLEPEAMWLGGPRGGHSVWEQTLMPQLTSWVLTAHLTF
jgi:TonB-linked SusC/RagA family outer membrane protein